MSQSQKDDRDGDRGGEGERERERGGDMTARNIHLLLGRSVI